MTDRQHEELKRLFELALAAPAKSRAAVLERECAGDVALRRRIEGMIAAAEDEHFLSVPTALKVPAAVPNSTVDLAMLAPLREGPGTRIGPYKLLQQIGEGGFGVVFMAEQEHPVRRKVALKIIKLGMDTRQVVARFEQERQALALMDHPNIARVIDAGATDTGRPYFVMDLVKGEPISEYCDKENLTIDERLDLFAQVCTAVQHAHSKGIIHRDLKPSNILVGNQDGRPHAKIIDFGIAKATSAKLTEKTLFTEHQQVIGTLQYMSPEQAEGSLDLDTRTDVYALGVVLYELLTGSTPFDSKTLRDAFYSEVQRMIREVEPPRPSTRLSNSADTLASIAASRRIEPKRLSGLVRGELDWIVMKALEKDRARRYETPSAFADDVRRYLSGEAVLAAPPSTAYRVQKFVRRHRVGVVTACVVTLALIAGLAGTWWGMVEAKRGRVEAELQTHRADEARNDAERQRAEADKQRDEAVKARAQTQRVADFQASMLRRVPSYEMGRDLATDLSARVRDAQQGLPLSDEQRARNLATFNGLLSGVSMTDAARRIIDANVLTPSAQSIAAEFGDEPLAQAALHESVADTYRNLGTYEKAKAEAERALALRLEHQGADHRDTLRAKFDLATFSFDLGEMDEAERILSELAPQLERAFGEEDSEALKARMCLAVLAMQRGLDDQARASFERILAIQERTLRPDDDDLALTSANLGMVLTSLNQVELATPLFERALAIRTHNLGADDLSTLHTQQQLAEAYQGQHRYDDANRLRLGAIETLGRIKGATHPDTVTAIAQLAELYRAQSRFDESEVQARRALELRRTALGDAHPLTIDSMSDVAIVCAMLGRYEEAEALSVEALERSTETLGADAPATMKRVNNLAVTYWYQGKLAEVEPLFARALAFNRRTLGEDHPDTAFAMLNMAILLHRLGRVKEERPLLEAALAIDRAKLGEHHENTVAVQSSLALLLLDTGEMQQAESLYRDVIAAQDRVLGVDDPATIESKSNLGALLLRTERYDEAEGLLLEVLERRRKTMGADNPETLRALQELAKLYTDSDRQETARPLLEDLVAARKRQAADPTAAPNALSDCALLLIDVPIEELRDAKLALEYARRANAMTDDREPQYLDTLARALDANGDRAGAIETMRRALALLPAEAPDRALFEERLKNFETARDGR